MRPEVAYGRTLKGQLRKNLPRTGRTRRPCALASGAVRREQNLSRPRNGPRSLAKPLKCGGKTNR